MGKINIPGGFVVRYTPDKVIVPIGMFWKVGEEEKRIFWCDVCSLKELREMEPPLTNIDKDWDAIRKELYDRGYSVAIYEPEVPIKCNRCGLISSNFGQA